MTRQILLGPQRPTLNLNAAFEGIDDDESIAIVSAGWQEAEGDVDDVCEVVGRPLLDLGLYRRAEVVLESDDGLQSAYRERQDRLQELQRLHRLRLGPSMRAAHDLLRSGGDAAMLSHERRHAIAQQRALDRHHLQRIRAIHNEFDAQLADMRPRLLGEHRAEIGEILARCGTVIITGGNVAVLLNRLRLFDLVALLSQKNIVAWSAGAMVLTDRVVLFHDNTPHGDRDAEVFDTGLGIIGDYVFLPDVRHRLKLSEKTRIALFSRRFAPAACVALDSGSMLCFRDGRVSSAIDVRRLSRTGSLRKVRA